MKTRLLLLSITSLLLLNHLWAQQPESKSRSYPSFTITPEPKLNYTKSILNQDFDFNLNSVEKGKFKLSYVNQHERYVTVRIYDFVGNLILQEQVPGQGLVNREYDLSFLKTKFFIVEVGNAKYNKTKSVMAI
jgi:hypothetical protein